MNTENEKNAKVDEVIKDPVMNNLVKLVKILCESRERQVKRNQKDTRRFKDIEKNHDFIKGIIEVERSRLRKQERELNNKIDDFKKDRWENEEEVDNKFNSYDKDIQDLKETVEDLKKIVQEQQKTIFNLKYPSVA